MKKNLSLIIASIVIIVGIVFGILSGFEMTKLQKEILKVVSIVALASALYCFIVGEITRNTSQMDKLWSVLPIAYTWIIAIKGGLSLRLIIFAVIVSLWGIRLTMNFARKGAYSIKFWQGKEDYRWEILRQKKIFQSKIVWAIFDLLFISIYQNLIVLAITLPAIMCVGETAKFGAIDIIVTIVALLFLTLETVADEYQWKFHQTKKKLLSEGKPLSELPSPYNKGFNTTGIWNFCRHPNYLGEQGIWFTLYFFSVGAGAVKYGIFNWTIIGSLLLIMIFMGSSRLGEAISVSKYPEYKEYQKKVCRYLPLHKYN
ncbi:MAG: DUF1295 domain-containing protein [Clostridia bacterium]|nr:DUF1295 domain-containing protein [Clostridia bacterium]